MCYERVHKLKTYIFLIFLIYINVFASKYATIEQIFASIMLGTILPYINMKVIFVHLCQYPNTIVHRLENRGPAIYIWCAVWRKVFDICSKTIRQEALLKWTQPKSWAPTTQTVAGCQYVSSWKLFAFTFLTFVRV